MNSNYNTIVIIKFEIMIYSDDIKGYVKLDENSGTKNRFL